ncbi:MAG: UDP-N-acetylmuramate dehydrogenase [Firmicutes bacterium]|nr:UDP-N-acetylmuramate dehydrogenase [Bacillota bacterium]
MEHVAREIKLNITGRVKTQELLARHTSFKIGGPADLYLEPENVTELAYVLTYLQSEGISYYILGNGTNLLVHDQGFRGAVICLAGQFREFTFSDLSVNAGAAVPLALLAQRATALGRTGLSFAAGIPGTVGGALVMNAGAHGHSLADQLVDAQILTGDMAVHIYQPEELELRYRKSNISPNDVVCAVTLRLEAGDKDDLERQSRDDLTFRRSRQPRQPNAGSIFKNPPGDAAGRLIEAVGLKGHRVGGAMISDIHANFIVNCQQATAQDVMALIATARREVAQQFGIKMELEIQLLGY